MSNANAPAFGAPRKAPTAPWPGRIAAMWADPMLRNSAYLALAVATMSFLGFVAWLVNARLFTPAEIGRATSLISAMSLIAYMSLLGFNGTLVRFLPTSERPKELIDTALTLCCVAGVVIGGLYVLALPVIAPQLSFMTHNLLYAVSFVVIAACSALNVLTDAVFIALRQARYNFIVDGVIQGSSKVLLPFLLVGLGAFGVFASSGIAMGLAVVASLYFMHRALGHRFTPVIRKSVVREAFTFSAASYVSSVFNLLPLLVVPTIVLDRNGAAAAGYYFVAFQLANLLYSLALAATEVLVAEASRAGSHLRSLALRSLLLVEGASIAGAVVIAVSGHFVLMLFGHQYGAHATSALLALAAGAPACALNAWASGLLKVSQQYKAMIISNVVYCAVIVGTAWMGSSHGLGAVSLSWMYGNFAAAAVAVFALGRRWRRTTQASGVTLRAMHESVV
jgi:O-antigen/teichoic acid export membrane protein